VLPVADVTEVAEVAEVATVEPLLAGGTVTVGVTTFGELPPQAATASATATEAHKLVPRARAP
jgi:hypothetical protein